MFSSEDRFELLRTVGAGGFGTVHQARDRLDGSIVAVKVLHPSFVLEAARFEREALQLTELQHPSVVRYLMSGQAENRQSWLAMEWLEGQTLAKRLQAGVLSSSEAITLARRVASALAMAEHKGIVHRNLKPANVLLGAADVADARLADLGLLGLIQTAPALTRTATSTRLYLSPEQARGDVASDARSDVFAMGCILYECLCGEPAFAGSNVLAALAKICLDEPARIETQRGKLSPKLSELVHGMLAKDAALRPTWRVVLDELESIFPGETGSTPSRPSIAVPGETRNSLAPRALRPSLRARDQQRVLCAVFVSRAASSARALSEKVQRALETPGARCEGLLDGSCIVTLDRHQTPGEQAPVAARCAMAIRRSLPDAAITICMGRVLIEGNLPFGDLIERGELLLKSTPPGHVRLDEGTAGLLDASFEIRGEELERYLVGERTGGEAPRTLLGQITPFVGRDRELKQLQLIFEECVDENVARAVLVTAPAGAGKSRLRYEVVQRLRAKGKPFSLLLARGDSMRIGTPFGVLTPALRAWADLAGSDSNELKQQKLRTRLGRVLPEGRIGPVAEFLGEMIGVAFPDEGSPNLRAARRDPQLMADRVLASWLEWLEAECQAGPVLFLVEDLHWSDPASVRFLEAALRTVSQRSLLVLAFARPEVREVYPELWSEREVIEVRLPKLGTKACERLLESIAGAGLNTETRTWLIDRAEGNAFFLEELVRGLKARKDERGLPETILGIIQARLDTLGEDAKLLLRAASVFGQAFRLDAVKVLLGGNASRVDVPSKLQMLAEREVIFLRGEAGEPEYVFRHALIRDAAYALLPEQERRIAHRLAGEWLEGHGSSEAALLADHFERGAVPERAASWYQLAAMEALEAGSLEDVVRCGERAVACGAQGEVLGEVSSMVAEALSYKGDAGTAEWAKRARETLRPGVAAWWRASQVLTISYFRQGSPLAADVVTEMVEMAAQPPSMAEQVVALAYVAGASFQVLQGDLGLRILELFPESVSVELRGRAQGCVYFARTMLEFSRANHSRAVRHARDSLDAFRKAGSVRDVAEVLNAAGYTLCELGAHEEAERYLAESVELGRRLGVKRWILDATQNLGVIHLRRAQLHEAQRVLSESADGWSRIQMPSCEAVSLFLCALAACANGEVDSASSTIDRALALGSSEPAVHAAALATLARIELLRGRTQEALCAAQRAMELLKAHQLFEHVALIRMAYVESLLASDRKSEARESIAEAYAWLLERASKIDDAALQTSFLCNIPENASIAKLSAQSLSAEAGLRSPT